MALPTLASAAVTSARSCEQADVQQAVNAAAGGDTVAVPTGSCTWAVPVVVPATKGLTLEGAGIDRTTITATGVAAIRLNTGSHAYRITGFTFVATTDALRMRGTSRSWRIDNNAFRDGRIWVNCACYGVIDHNIFSGPQRSLIWVMENSYDMRGEGFAADGGAASWARPLSLGTADAVYVEDNVFDFAVPTTGYSAIDGRSGGRVVFRHNSVKNMQWGGHDAEIAHERGQRQFEFYNNTFTYTHAFQMSMFHRGGTGVIFGNRFKAVHFFWAGTPLIVRNSRSDGGEAGRDPWLVTCDGTAARFCLGGPPALCQSNADCTRDFVGPCVALDGRLDATGWPCRDQLGWSTDNPVTGIQLLEPVYLWNNYFCYGPGGVCNPEPPPAGSGRIATLFVHAARQHIVANRDYFEQVSRPGYTPYVYPHPLTRGPTAASPPVPRGLRVQ